MMVKSNNCSDSLPGPDEVHAFIKDEKEKFGENDRKSIKKRSGKNGKDSKNDNCTGNCKISG